MIQVKDKKPKSWVSIFLLAFSGITGSMILIYLGYWQLERHGWKQDIKSRIENAPQQTPISILEVNSKNMADYEFKRFEIMGFWGKGPNLFITGRTRNNQIGYHLFNIIQLPNKMFILVNIGWVGHKEFPSRNYHEANFIGRLRLADKPGWFMPGHSPEKQEFSSIDTAAISQATGIDLLPYYVDYVREDNGRQPFPLENNVRLSDGHMGYAIIWFVLAVVWTIGFMRLTWAARYEET